MSRRNESRAEELVQSHVLVVGNLLQVLERRGCVPFGVQSKRRAVPGEPFAIGVLGILFLQLCRVRQQHLQQIYRSSGGEDRSGKSIANQSGQVSRVVNVSVGEKGPGYR